MKILVTGGRGVIGTSLLKELRQRGHDAVSCDLMHAEDETGFRIARNSIGTKYFRCDIGNFRQLDRLVSEWGPFNVVYNCAAEFGRWNGEDFYEQLWMTNVVGLKNIIRLQERHGFRLVHCSSSEVYGDWPFMVEESVMGGHGIIQLNDYAMTKWVNEMQIANSEEQCYSETVIVRLFNTYGPGEYYSPYRSVNCRFLYSALKGLPWTVFRGHTRTSTYLPDATRTMANITDNFKPGEVYNIGGDQEHTIEELSDVVILVTGAEPGLACLSDGPEPFTTSHKHLDTSKAKRDLDHRHSCDLETGMGYTAEWMRGVYL